MCRKRVLSLPASSSQTIQHNHHLATGRIHPRPLGEVVLSSCQSIRKERKAEGLVSYRLDMTMGLTSFDETRGGRV
jgi:hypothetical protein